MENTKEIHRILQIVDEWLKSDDTFVTNKFGQKIEGHLIDCKKGTLLKRLIALEVADWSPDSFPSELVKTIFDAPNLQEKKEETIIEKYKDCIDREINGKLVLRSLQIELDNNEETIHIQSWVKQTYGFISAAKFGYINFLDGTLYHTVRRLNNNLTAKVITAKDFYNNYLVIPAEPVNDFPDNSYPEYGEEIEVWNEKRPTTKSIMLFHSYDPRLELSVIVQEETGGQLFQYKRFERVPKKIEVSIEDLIDYYAKHNKLNRNIITVVRNAEERI